MLNALIETSTFISFLRKLDKDYRYFGLSLNEIYKNSQTYRLILIQEPRNKINVYLKYSFLGKITETGKGNDMILNKSKAVRWLINLCNKKKQKIILCLKISRINNSIKVFKKESYSFSIKTASFIIVVAVITNTAFSILLKNEIGLLEWVIRILLLFIGITGLNSSVDWPTLKSNSVILRWVSSYVRNLRKDKP